MRAGSKTHEAGSFDLARLRGADGKQLTVIDHLRRVENIRPWAFEQIGRREELDIAVSLGGIVGLQLPWDRLIFPATGTEHPAIGQ